jgi:hypothetical protein
MFGIYQFNKMKNILFLIFIVCFFLSCKNKRERNLEIMQSEFETYLKDNTFRENAQLTIFELKAISYDTLDINYIDTIKVYNAIKKRNHFNKLLNLKTDLIKSKMNTMQIYSDLGSKTLYDYEKEEIDKHIKEGKDYQDSILYYSAIDSTITERIKQRKNPEDIYRTKFFVKATYTKDGKDDNLLDTIIINFTKELKVIQY